ncbi:MAG: S8 family serine peptidase [Bdellovibrionales bacterium]|nr:S8 family serine peptidase [Bdellovibrionales bacterium]
MSSNTVTSIPSLYEATAKFAFVVALLILIPLTSFGKEYKSVPGELVVRLKQDSLSKTTAATVLHSVASSLSQKLNLKTTVKTRSFATSADFAVISVPEADKARSIGLLQQDARVAYAEPNYLYSLYEDRADDPRETTPNDSMFGRLWGMKNTGQTDDAGQAGRAGADIHVASVWADGITGSRNIKVAVIDTGVDYTHPDLTANVWTNPGEVAGDGIDNDGDGFVDDVHGWNFSVPAGSPTSSDPRDDHYHGTHCAGTIGALGNNTQGVAGVNWNVTIIPIKFLNSQGSGTLEGAVSAIQYATLQHVNLMSNSWGGGPFTQSLYDTIKEARDAGILFVAAAGNDANDNDATPSYPASYQLENVISVAATDNLDHLASFSNFGRTKVHVAAPGVKILSTVPASQGNYKVLSGTSMATPHVSGIAALMLSANSGMSYADIKSTLIRTSDPIRALSKRSVSGGRVNVYNALHGIIPPAIPAPDESAWVDYAFTAESVHPYPSNANLTYPISVPGARYIRVVFENIDTEASYDFVTVTDANGDEIEAVSGAKTNYVTDYLSGDHAVISLKSDASVNKSGFKVARLQAVY